MGVSILEAVLLGVLQGLTEFLPVSSDGHLALAQLLFRVESSGLLLALVLHAGTLVATLLFFRQRIAVLIVDSFRYLTRRVSWADAPGARDAAFVVVASVPTAVIGLTLKDRVVAWSSSPWAIALGFLTTGLILLSTRLRPPGERQGVSHKLALLLGVLQGCAVLPGVSRSGSTIAGALLVGVAPARAFELSMLMSVPAVAGAFLLEMLELESAPAGVFNLVCGAVTACVVGLLALAFLRHLVTLGRLSWFALWVLPLAFATLGLAWAWPGS